MAVDQALLSGGWRISSTSGLFQQNFTNSVTVSASIAMDFVLLPGVSDFVVSLAVFSNMNVIGFQANNQIRVNFGGVGGASYVSNASAGLLTTQWAWTNGGGSGPLSLRLANSGADSSTVRLLMCTS